MPCRVRDTWGGDGETDGMELSAYASSRYQPNEVKHRKRTTRSQLRVLEGVYTHDTKPNAMLRKKLADELGMTPRGVQVRPSLQAFTA